MVREAQKLCNVKIIKLKTPDMNILLSNGATNAYVMSVEANEITHEIT